VETKDFITQLSMVLGYDAGESRLDEMLVRVANYARGTEKIAQDLKAEAEGYYNQWCFCKDHNFELDALHQRGKYDVTSSHLRNIKTQFGIVLD
jgi:hypothetical protein